MAKRSYSDKDKAKALELYKAEGPSAAERKLGIPKSTLRSWAKKAGVRTERIQKTQAAVEAAQADRALARESVKGKLLDRLNMVLDEMLEPAFVWVGKGEDRAMIEVKQPAANLKDLATTAGILLDKLRLEEGKATGRNENIFTSELDNEIEQLVTELGGAS